MAMPEPLWMRTMAVSWIVIVIVMQDMSRHSLPWVQVAAVVWVAATCGRRLRRAGLQQRGQAPLGPASGGARGLAPPPTTVPAGRV